MLTCWPKGLLDTQEAEAVVAMIDEREKVSAAPLTVEEEMAREKLEAAVAAGETE